MPVPFGILSGMVKIFAFPRSKYGIFDLTLKNYLIPGQPPSEFPIQKRAIFYKIKASGNPSRGGGNAHCEASVKKELFLDGNLLTFKSRKEGML